MADIEVLFSEKRKYISEYLNRFIELSKKNLHDKSLLSIDYLERLKFFSVSGKMLRGILLMTGYSLWRNDDLYSETVIGSAASIELFHSSLLVHDDIMDRDNYRRGNKSIHYQYEEMAKDIGFKENKHFGRSAGICAGDISIFLAYELLSLLPINPEIFKRIISIISEELSFVALAQLDDLFVGYKSNSEVNENDIFRIYLYKTARYTFSMPLLIGSILAGKDEKDLKLLSIIGENMGIVFQIIDDSLSLFGNEQNIGKSVGIDIKEGKKTFHYYYLLKYSEENDREFILKNWGSKNKKIINQIIKIFKKYFINEMLTERLKYLYMDTRNKIEKLNPPYNKELLLNILDYNFNRKK